MEHDLFLRLDVVEAKLDAIMALITTQGAKMSAELDALKAEVDATRDLEASAVTLIQGLAQQIADAANDPAAITALAQELRDAAAPLAAAVAANTPAQGVMPAQ